MELVIKSLPRGEHRRFLHPFIWKLARSSLVIVCRRCETEWERDTYTHGRLIKTSRQIEVARRWKKSDNYFMTERAFERCQWHAQFLHQNSICRLISSVHFFSLPRLDFFQVIRGVHLEDKHVIRKRSLDQPLRILLYYDESVFRWVTIICVEWLYEIIFLYSIRKTEFVLLFLRVSLSRAP